MFLTSGLKFGFNCNLGDVSNWKPENLSMGVTVVLKDRSSDWSIDHLGSFIFLKDISTINIQTIGTTLSYSLVDITELHPDAAFKLDRSNTADPCSKEDFFKVNFLSSYPVRQYPVGYGTHSFDFDWPTIDYNGALKGRSYKE